MKKSDQDKLNVILLLKENGFVDDGFSSGEIVKSWNNNEGHAMLMNFPARVRLKLENTDWKATIGVKTTCIYKIENKPSLINHHIIKNQVTESTSFDTKDIEKIKVFINGIIGVE